MRAELLALAAGQGIRSANFRPFLAAVVPLPQRVKSDKDVAIHFADQELRPQADIRLVVEKQPDPKNVTEPHQNFVVLVEDSQGKKVQEQTLELSVGRPVETSFRAEKEDMYTVKVLDAHRVLVASRLDPRFAM